MNIYDSVDTLIRNLVGNRKIQSQMEVLGPRLSVVITRRIKPDKRHSRQEFVVTFGAPNYRGRELIKRAKRHGFDYPLQDSRFYKKG